VHGYPSAPVATHLPKLDAYTIDDVANANGSLHWVQLCPFVE